MRRGRRLPKRDELAAPPGGSWLVAATDVGEVLALDVDTGAVDLVGRHVTGVLAVAVSSDATLVASAARDVAKIWDAVARVELAEFATGPGDVFALCFSPDGRTLAIAGQAGLHLLDCDEIDERAERHEADLIADVEGTP